MAARKRRSSRQKVSLFISLRMACPLLKACRRANRGGSITLNAVAKRPPFQLIEIEISDVIVVCAPRFGRDDSCSSRIGRRAEFTLGYGNNAPKSTHR